MNHKQLTASLLSKLSVILLQIVFSKQKLLFSSMIFYLRAAECFCRLMNKLPPGSGYLYVLPISQYIVVFTVMWSCSKPSSGNSRRVRGPKCPPCMELHIVMMSYSRYFYLRYQGPITGTLYARSSAL